MLQTDFARQWTDAELSSLERRMKREYGKAAREMREKQSEWLAKYEKEKEQREKALDDTPEANDAHRQWLRGQAARGKWVSDMADGLAKSASQANAKATAMINDTLPRVFSENANMAAFELDGKLGYDTGFTLVNEDAVRRLMGLSEAKSPQIVPEVVEGQTALGPADVQSIRKRELDYPKDMRWNRQKFTSAITQGILQGESIPNIVKRTEAIYGQNRNAAVRAARTATTNAENAGRVHAFERAQRLGIDMELEWLATLDGRTRDSHRALDGERVKFGEAFSNGLRWPSDPNGPESEVWNCRCRANGRVMGFDGVTGDWTDERGERWSRLPSNMTYEEWKAAKPVSRAESYMNASGMVSPQWYANGALGTVTAAFNAALAVDNLHPSSVGGVVRTSEAMTFEDANGLKGNPRYEIDPRLKDAYDKAYREYMGVAENPEIILMGREEMRAKVDELRRNMEDARKTYNDALKARQAYTINCQTCVVANEARRRGYDVMATGNTKGSINEKLANNTRLAWIDPATGKHPDYIKYSGRGKADWQGRPIPNKTTYWKWLNSEGTIEEGKRYTIEFEWKGKTHSGHIVSLERVGDRLRIYDPQNGKTMLGDEVRKYLANVKYSRKSYDKVYAWGPDILRIDNMEFNSDITDAILEARQ